MPSAQLTRQWLVLRTLESSRTGKTVAELAQEIGANTRNIYRDLEDLEAAGFPIVRENKRRSLIDGWRFRVPEPFNPTELMSLWLYRDLVKGFDGTPIYDSLESLFHKVQATLPPESLAYLERIKSSFSVGLGPCKDYSRIREILEVVHDGVVNRKRLEIAYLPLRTDKEVLRKVDPYKVWFFEGSLYLIAYCHLRDDVRMFVLDRMKMVRATEDCFEDPEDFDLDEFLKHSFKVMRGDEVHEVRIRISPKWARYVAEKTWHQSQEVEEQEDGSIIISFTVANLGEVKRWVLSMGKEAMVLEPEELRGELCQEIISLDSLYLEPSKHRRIAGKS